MSKCTLFFWASYTELLLEHLRGDIIWSTDGCAHLLRITAASCQSLTNKVEVLKSLVDFHFLFCYLFCLGGLRDFDWLRNRVATRSVRWNVFWSQTPYSKSDWAAKAQRKLMDGNQPTRSGWKPSAAILPKEVFFTSLIHPKMVLRCFSGLSGLSSSAIHSRVPTSRLPSIFVD